MEVNKDAISHLLKISLIGGVLLYFFVKRIWNNQSSKKASKNFANKIENDLEFAQNFSEELDILVTTENLSIKSKVLNELQLLVLKSYNKIDNFQIKSCTKINSNSFILVTLAEYKDLSGNNRRNPQEVTHYLDLYFKIFFDETKIKFYSNLHETNLDKNLRKEFVNKFLTKIQK